MSGHLMAKSSGCIFLQVSFLYAGSYSIHGKVTLITESASEFFSLQFGFYYLYSRLNCLSPCQHRKIQRVQRRFDTEQGQLQ